MNCIAKRKFDQLPSKPKLLPPSTDLQSANKSKLLNIGECYLSFSIGTKNFYHKFHIVDGLNSEALLGLKWQQQYKISSNWNRNGRHFINLGKEFLASSLSTNRQFPRARTKGNITLQPNSISILEITTPKTLTSTGGYCLDSSNDLSKKLIPLDIIHRFQKTPGSLYIPVMNVSTTKQVIPKNTTLGKFVAIEEEINEVEETDWSEIKTDQKSNVTVKLPSYPTGTPFQMEKPFKRNDTKLKDAANTDQYRKKIVDLLQGQYAKIVSKSSTDVGRTKIHEMEIKTRGDPVSVRPYTIALKHQPFVEEEIRKLEEAGLIQRSISDWSSPLICVPKKADKEKPEELQLRLVIDYRQVNKQIVTSREPSKNGKVGKVIANYPLPNIENLLARLQGAKYFSILDLRSGYHHIGLHKNSRHLTAFTTPAGKFEYTVLPFGLNISPTHFSFCLQKALGSEISHFCLNYLDDLIIFSRTAEEHLQHVTAVFNKLAQADFKIKPSKCEFFKSEVGFLGHIVTSEGVKGDPEKITAIQNLKPPKNVEQLRHLLGLTGFYRKYIDKYSDITHCLYSLLKKGVDYNWTNTHDSAVATLKNCLSQQPVMILPTIGKTFYCQTDASKYGFSGILQQKRANSDTELGPIAYFSGTFSGPQLNWSTTEKEAYAIYKSIKKFAFYIEGHECIVLTDHKPLKPFFQQGMKIPKLDRWSIELQHFDLKFQFVAGSLNTVADKLSRIHLQELGLYIPNEGTGTATKSQANIVESIESIMEDCEEIKSNLTDIFETKNPISTEELVQKQKRDKRCKILIKRNNQGTYLDDAGILTKIVRIQDELHHLPVLPISLLERVIFCFHNCRGHQGVARVTNSLRRLFYISNLRLQVYHYIKKCDFCKRHSPNLAKYKSLHLQVPDIPFEGIAMDLIGKLPTTSKGNKYALTVIDLFSNYLIVVPLQDKTAEAVINAYTLHIFTRFGASKFILSDNGKEFKNHILQEVCNKLNTEHKFSNAYYPKGNSRIENVHNFLKRSIAKYQDTYSQLEWDDAIYLACYAFNISETCDNLNSPFFINHGKHPLDPQLKMLHTSQHYFGNNQGLLNLHELRRIWTNHAKYTRDIRLRKANKTDRHKNNLPRFSPGDQVLLKNFTRGVFDPRFNDFCTVVEQINPTTVKVVNASGQNFKVNIHHLKLCQQRRSYNLRPRKR